MMVNFMLTDPPLNQPLVSRACHALIGLRSGSPEIITVEGGDDYIDWFTPDQIAWLPHKRAANDIALHNYPGITGIFF